MTDVAEIIVFPPGGADSSLVAFDEQAGSLSGTDCDRLRFQFQSVPPERMTPVPARKALAQQLAVSRTPALLIRARAVRGARRFHAEMLSGVIDQGKAKGMELDQFSFSYSFDVGPAGEVYPSKVTIAGYVERRAGPSTAEQPAIKVGGYAYPLRRPLSERDLVALGKRLLGQGAPSPDTVGRALHARFQRLYRTPVHERTPEDEELWSFLLTIVDYQAYRWQNPLPETLVGRVLRIDFNNVAVCWFGGDEEVFDFSDFDGRMATANPGDTITVSLKRFGDGRVRVLDCTVSAELRPDEEVVRQLGSQIKSLDGLPVGDWPKKGVSQ